jgi:hypothetical protein
MKHAPQHSLQHTVHTVHPAAPRLRLAHGLFLGFLTGSCLLSGEALALSDVETENRVQQSQATLQRFAGQLQGELREAMQRGGPVEAIQVCQQRAPEIAAELSLETGWTVRRTSLKLRNPANAPDEWERAALLDFDARQATGTPAPELIRHGTTSADGIQEFRYMRAIPTDPVCLTCHGDHPDAQIRHALERFYPDDQATGYQAGQIRGAFSIIQRM